MRILYIVETGQFQVRMRDVRALRYRNRWEREGKEQCLFGRSAAPIDFGRGMWQQEA